MLIAISGSQGSGKSTVLAELEKLGYETIQRKTSRSILADWGVTLQEVYDDPELVVKFQGELVKRKAEDEDEAVLASNKIVFTERTFADLFTYALVVLGSNNEYSEFLDEYYKQCLVWQQRYAHNYYLKAGLFDVKHDGVRGSNQHYSTMVDLTMWHYTDKMTPNGKTFIIDTPSLEDRIALITAQSEALL